MRWAKSERNIDDQKWTQFKRFRPVRVYAHWNWTDSSRDNRRSSRTANSETGKLFIQFSPSCTLILSQQWMQVVLNYLQISWQLWWRRRGKPWQKFEPQLGAHKTTQIDTYVSDKWRATDVETNEVYVINNKKKYRPKANTGDTRAVCIIKRKG